MVKEVVWTSVAVVTVDSIVVALIAVGNWATDYSPSAGQGKGKFRPEIDDLALLLLGVELEADLALLADRFILSAPLAISVGTTAEDLGA